MNRFGEWAGIGLLAATAALWADMAGTHTAAAQQVPAAWAAKDFAGTWNWMFQDKHFATMIVELKDGQLSGTITNEWMNMDAQGHITGAEARPGTSPIVKTSIENKTLVIYEKTADEELQWTMTLTSPTTAELRIRGADAPANAEPIRLEKVWSEPPLRD